MSNSTTRWIRMAVATIALGVPVSASAQGIFRNLAPLTNDCRPTPVLKAASGGGIIQLATNRTARIPYGVKYRFRHQITGAEFVYLTLESEGARPQTISVQPASESECYDAELPAFPPGVTITLRETQGFALTGAERTTLSNAVEALVTAYMDVLYSGEGATAFTNADSLKAFLSQQLTARNAFAPFEGLRVRRTGAELATDSLTPVIQNLFFDRVPSLTRLPHQISAAQQLFAALPATCPQGAAATSVARYDALRSLLGVVSGISKGSEIASAYLTHKLPLPDSLVTNFAADLAQCLPNRPAAARAALQGMLAPLTVNELKPLLDATEAAKRVVEQSFKFEATELFPGATTTLQRYGQFDVSNAFFGQNDIRVLGTFSIYPGDLRYGGQIDPDRVEDRFVFTFGYSLATVTESDTTSSGPQGKAYTVGVGFRVSPQISVGTGRWFSEGSKRGWYLSVSGDLGMIPGLKELLVRSPGS